MTINKAKKLKSISTIIVYSLSILLVLWLLHQAKMAIVKGPIAIEHAEIVQKGILNLISMAQKHIS
jgi:hypothetical protein